MDSEDKILEGSEADAPDAPQAVEDQEPNVDAPENPETEAASSPEASDAEAEQPVAEADSAEEPPPLPIEDSDDGSVDGSADVPELSGAPEDVESEAVEPPAEEAEEAEAVDSSPITESPSDEELFLAALSDDAPEDGLYTPLRRGQIVTGVIASKTDGEILVDVGAKSEGLIAGREMETLDEATRAALNVGDEIEVYVLRAEDRQGHPILSIQRAQEAQDWVKAEEYLESKENFETKIAGYNKGGLIVNFGMVRGFLPASQVSQTRRRSAGGSSPSERWGEMIGDDITVKVIEVNRAQNRLILSERAAAREVREERRAELIESLSVGQVIEGTVVRLTDFGAFVDIGGADGLIHLSELAWKHISHPKEVVKVGDKVTVEVINIDPDRQRIGLSRKNQLQDPWETLVEEYSPDELVQATITKLTKFGAFARLIDRPAIEGLIHISELADRRVGHPKEVVSEGDVVTLRIIRIEPDRRRLGLSLKRVDSEEYIDEDWESLYEAAVGGGEEEPDEMESLYAAASHDDSEEVVVEVESVEEEPAEDEEPAEAEDEAVEEEPAEAEDEAVEEEPDEAEVEVAEEDPGEDEEEG